MTHSSSNISVLYSLPNDLIRDVVSIWLATEDLIKLDTSTCNRLLRQGILKILKGMPASYSFTDHSLKYVWIKLRGLFVTHIVTSINELLQDFADDMVWSKVEIFEVKYGFSMRDSDDEFNCLEPLIDILPLCTSLKKFVLHYEKLHDSGVKEIFGVQNYFEQLQLLPTTHVHNASSVSIGTIKHIFSVSPNLHKFQCSNVELVREPPVRLHQYLLAHPVSLRGTPIECDLRIRVGPGDYRGYKIHGTSVTERRGDLEL